MENLICPECKTKGTIVIIESHEPYAVEHLKCTNCNIILDIFHFAAKAIQEEVDKQIVKDAKDFYNQKLDISNEEK